jgi:hypothetical protein
MSSGKRNLVAPPLDPTLLAQLRTGLLEDYKHKPMPGTTCALCGSSRGRFALHVLEFSHAETLATPTAFVAMVQSRGAIRGSIPVCEWCARPCATCGLPVATPWVERMRTALAREWETLSIRAGRGICQHVHPIADLLSLFRVARLPR